MVDSDDFVGQENDQELMAAREASEQKPREALQRLRRLGEDLPANDAVALVREGRDAVDESY